MNVLRQFLGIYFLVMLVYGCAVNKPIPSPDKTSPPPEFTEMDIQPETSADGPAMSKPIIAKVTAYRLNLRASGFTKGRILGVLKKGDEVAVQSKKGRWVNVHSRSGLQGWVSGRYIALAGGMSIDEALASKNDSKRATMRAAGLSEGGVGASGKGRVVKSGGSKKRRLREGSKIVYDRSIFKTPINKAIEKMLLASGDDIILKTATGISSSSLGDFAIANINCKQNDEKTRVKAYLFKQKGRWVAYKTIPTKLDRPGLFWILAQQDCAQNYKAFHGIGYGEKKWKKNSPRRRDIHFICSESIDKQLKDHSLKFTFNFDKNNGWQISQILEIDTGRRRKARPVGPGNTKSISQLSFELASKKERVKQPDEVVDRFFMSILIGDMTAVKGFLADGMSPNVKRPRLGHSPLFAAVMGHKDKIAQLFIDKGGEVEFKAEDGLTPLILASGNCNSAPLVKALIEAGADVNAQAKGGETPLMGAEVMRCNEIVDILKRAGAR